jgi:hypothetical protein
MPRDKGHIDMLGYTFLPTHVKMRKRIKQNFARRWKNAKSEKRQRDLLASYYGWCKWGNCHRIFETITDMSFNALGIKPQITTKDGRRFLDGKSVSAMTILNMPIKIIDFETGVKTRHGEGRYAILIEVNGEQVKIITNSVTLKSQLDQARQMQQAGQKVFPIETKMHRRELGNNKHDFNFE